MKKLLLLLLIVPVCLVLPGCSQTRQPEHQAFAISLSADLLDDGQMLIAVQVPTFGGEASPSDKGGGGEGGEGGSSPQSNYAIYSATGASFPEALDLLQSTIPNTLKLTQLKSIVFNDKLARSEQFGRVVEQMVMTYQIFGAASAIMCLGSAREFIENQHPVIGVRLSTSIASALEHYFLGGYTTLTSLYGLNASNKSIYSDPVITVAAVGESDEAEQIKIEPNLMGNAIAGKLPREGSNPNQYMGCALVLGGRVIDILDGRLCQWMEMLNADVKSVNYMCDGISVQLSVLSRPKFDIRLKPDGIDVSLNVKLLAVPLIEAPDEHVLREKIKGEILDLIDRCQAAGVEPFNLAELAAINFLTVQDFQNYHFRDKFCASDVAVTVDIVMDKS